MRHPCPRTCVTHVSGPYTPAPPRFSALGPPAWGGTHSAQHANAGNFGYNARTAVEDRATLPTVPARLRHRRGDTARAASPDAACIFSWHSRRAFAEAKPHPHAGGPNAINLGGRGAEPLSSPPPAKLSLHFLWRPVCQPRVAAGRLGASGGWRLAAWLASQRLPVGRFAGWRDGEASLSSALPLTA
jgi:hypothetical protein